MKNMKVDIWSDIRCPFCYVGKRKFERALEQFPNAKNIEINWHSFQLDPDLKTDADKDNYEYLASRKGISVEEAKILHGHAKNAGPRSRNRF